MTYNYGPFYEENDEKYKKNIKDNYRYLVDEIPFDLIMPSLKACLHPADYDELTTRRQLKAERDCNAMLLTRLQKCTYWWRVFRNALVDVTRRDIIERLKWNEDTFDFGSSENTHNTGIAVLNNPNLNPPSLVARGQSSCVRVEPQPNNASCRQIQTVRPFHNNSEQDSATDQNLLQNDEPPPPSLLQIFIFSVLYSIFKGL